MVFTSKWSLDDTNLLVVSIETLGNESDIWKPLSVLFKRSVIACKRKYRRTTMDVVPKAGRNGVRKAVRKAVHIPSKGKQEELISDEELLKLELECFDVILSDRVNDEYDIFMSNSPVDIFDISTFHFTPN